MRVRKIIQLSLFLLLLSQLSFAYAARTNIQKISAYILGEKVRVVVSLNQATKHNAFSLKTPSRIVVDLNNTNLVKKTSLPTFSHVAWIKSFKVAPNKVGTQRMVFTLTRPATEKISLLKPTSTKPWRIVIDLVPITAVVNTSKATLQKTAQQNKLRCVHVVIDPGHGGKDTGAIGINGIREKNVVLAIGKYLDKLVKTTPGLCAYMTRDKDYFVTLRGRLNIARKDNADLFVAIHADMFHNSLAKGATVFALSQRGATSEAARWLAQRENTSELIGGTEIDHTSKSLKTVLLKLSQNATTNRSLELGGDVLENLDKVSKLHHKIVEQAGFVVLKSPDIPSILVETGYLSNKDEENKLRQAWYQKKIANAIYQGILKYVYRYPPPGSEILAWEHSEAHSYVVKSGDNLSGIAQKNNTSVKKIKETNHLTSDQVYVGQKLMV